MPHTDKDYSLIVALFTWVCPGGHELLPLIRSKTYYFSLPFVSVNIKLTQTDKTVKVFLKYLLPFFNVDSLSPCSGACLIVGLSPAYVYLLGSTMCLSLSYH